MVQITHGFMLVTKNGILRIAKLPLWHNRKKRIIQLTRKLGPKIFPSEKQTEEVVWRCSIKKVFLKISQKFTGKHLCQSLFFNKVCNFIKKETLAKAFSCEFCETFKNTFFAEHLRTTTSKQFFDNSHVAIVTQ